MASLWGGREKRGYTYRNQTTTKQWEDFLTSGYNLTTSGEVDTPTVKNVGITFLDGSESNKRKKLNKSLGGQAMTVDTDQLELLSKAFTGRLASIQGLTSRPGMKQVI